MGGAGYCWATSGSGGTLLSKERAHNGIMMMMVGNQAHCCPHTHAVFSRLTIYILATAPDTFYSVCCWISSLPPGSQSRLTAHAWRECMNMHMSEFLGGSFDFALHSEERSVRGGKRERERERH